MGRKPKLTAPQDVPAVEDEQDFFDEVLAGFDEENGVEIEGRIYRKTKPEDSIGRMSFEAIAKVNEIVDEDWIGRHFGGGNYFVKWTFKQGDRKEVRQKNYAVGPEYDKFIKTAVPAVSGAVPAVSGLDLGGLLGSLTVDKIMAITAGVKAIKEIFAPPPPPQPDYTKLLEIVLANNQKSTPSDAIVTACLANLQKPQHTQPPQTLAQQIADFKALKETFKDEFSNDSTDGGDEMSFLLEKGLELLPVLLQKKNNDFRAVGAEVRDNPLIKSVISSNPELTQKFFEQARAQYGDAAVQQLAAGFGLKATIIPAQTAEGVQNGSKEN
jgi:hypothetical protein